MWLVLGLRKLVCGRDGGYDGGKGRSVRQSPRCGDMKDSGYNGG